MTATMNSARTMSREIGTALAVLAIYLFTILAPLHQARASQLVFEELGYSTIQTGWVFCSAENRDGQDDDITVTKCPAAGIGKPAVIAPELVATPLNLRASLLSAPGLAPVAHEMPAPIAPPAGPRAPPERI